MCVEVAAAAAAAVDTAFHPFYRLTNVPPARVCFLQFLHRAPPRSRKKSMRICQTSGNACDEHQPTSTRPSCLRWHRFVYLHRHYSESVCQCLDPKNIKNALGSSSPCFVLLIDGPKTNLKSRELLFVGYARTCPKIFVRH